MTSPTAVAPPTEAVSAFLRGLDRRARLVCHVQSGSREAASQAMAVAARVFAAEAQRWPIAGWPVQYWRMLLAAPSMRAEAAIAPDLPLPGVARLPAQARAAVLLLLVAGLDEAAAADVLQLSVPEVQALVRASLPPDALGHPDVDVWRAWRAAAQRELARVHASAPALATAAPAARHASQPRRTLRWLWAGVLLGLLAFAATFLLHPAGRDAVQRWRQPIKHVALPPADPPRARFDPADPGLHPDRALLAAPAELRVAREAALLAWWTATQPPALDAEPVPPAVAPVDDGTPRQRRQAWDGLSHAQRGADRAAWEAWRALPEAERALLRGAAQRLALLAPDARAQLRAQFEGQPPDARHGWWLGPWLGGEWPRVAPLFAYVDEDQRAALLELLRQGSPADLYALERLAQGTPPEQRQAVRERLLELPPAARSAWLQARFSR